MGAPVSVMLTPGPDHLHVMDALMAGAGRCGGLTPDADLAALALENGGTISPQDADFARFHGVRWINPCA